MPFFGLLPKLRRFFPVIAFFGGFLWDALTLGERVRPLDFWRLGLFLAGAAGLVVWLAWRDYRATPEPWSDGSLRGRLQRLAWAAPYLVLQFFFGGIFSALFILYVKSSGHFAAWLVAAALGGLLVANEFWGRRYGERFTLTWGLFALNAILLCNFALPHAVGSLDPLWFYASTALGVLLAHALHRLAPGSPGKIMPAWGVGALLLALWNLGMIAPVPLVKRDLAVGQQFAQRDGVYLLQIEPAPAWQFWREASGVAHVPEGGRLYGVSAVYAPAGVAARLEHRWESRGADGVWRPGSRIRFVATGGREQGFRGYSYVVNPAPGDWRLTVATQDGRTISTFDVRVERGEPQDPASRSF